MDGFGFKIKETSPRELGGFGLFKIKVTSSRELDGFGFKIKITSSREWVLFESTLESRRKTNLLAPLFTSEKYTSSKSIYKLRKVIRAP